LSVAAGALAAVASLVGSSHAGIVYNAYNEWNGTQGGTTGVWSYGKVDQDGLNFAQTSFSGGMFGTTSVSSVGRDEMHPGTATGTGGNPGGRANLRFIAPTAGTYLATFRAKLNDPLNTPFGYGPDYRRDGVRMWVDGTLSKDLQTWDQPTAAASFQYQTLTKQVYLTAGQTFDFSIDPNGAYAFEYGTRLPKPANPGGPYYGSNLYDTTGYTATVEMLSSEVVPEPGMFVIAAFNVAGMIVARRRKARHA
jgi:hypothetical protein